MPELYPLLLLPEFRERVWGSRDLSLLYPHKVARRGGEFERPIGEVWLTGDECQVANGPLAGQRLAEVTRRFTRALVGEAAPEAERFPLLLKFLFPQEKLSVQVHPDDDGARAIGQKCGKTECWYVLAAEPDAQVGLGLKPGVGRKQVETAITENRLEELMRWIPARPGELIYVDAGTVHAIGPGLVLVETQQNSDTTYRLYDYGRPRELHVREGLAALKEKTHAGKVPRSSGGDGAARLVASPCFLVDKYVVKSPRTLTRPVGRSAVQVLVALDGGGVIEVDGAAPVTLAKGEAAVIPAAIGEYRLRPQWALEVLVATLPGQEVPQPVTSL